MGPLYLDPTVISFKGLLVLSQSLIVGWLILYHSKLQNCKSNIQTFKRTKYLFCFVCFARNIWHNRTVQALRKDEFETHWVQMNLFLLLFLLPGTVKLGTGCCGYGKSATGKTATGYDCAVIPQASNTAGVIQTALANGICGGRLGLTAGSTTAKTVCCK